MEDSVKYHITWDRRCEFDTGRSSQKPGDRLPASIRKRAFGPRGFASALTDFVFAEDPVSEADIIFVPGNGYPQMAEEAAALYRRGYAPRILPSGRFYIYDDAFDGVKARQEIYTGPYETEWAFARDVLIKNGVPEAAILREDRAGFTYENALYSRTVLDEAGIWVTKGIVCCLACHAARCRQYYRLLFPEAEIMIHPTPANGITRDNWMTTPEGITIVTGETARCGQQFEDILMTLAAEAAKPQ